MNKRNFLKQIGLLSLGTPALFTQLEKTIAAYAHFSPEELARKEDFWAKIRGDYRLKPDYINLENGYYCFMPQEVLENYIHHIRRINYEGSYYLRTVQFENKRKVKERLAAIAQCSPEELIITRNTTESLDMIIDGFPWEKGDEAVMAVQDYGAMLDMFQQQERQHGIVNKIVSVPNHPTSDSELIELYTNAITPKTKLLMVCHLINITGQVLPIRKIVDMAHEKGVQVMVDGAHAFSQMQFNIPDLGCDYYGASLHKWLSAPLGSGILYVKKEHIPNIKPLFAEGDWAAADDIARLNHTGTHPVATDLGIIDAIEYQERLGLGRKEARLRYLQHYWTSRVRDLPNVIVNTPADQSRHCAIGNVGVKGMKPSDLAKTLLDKYGIWTVAISRENVQGCRITPNVYTTTRELDVLVIALGELGA
ncbi:MAG: aminotransferase class V-fold PLP-dependent enzyme [Bacteroidota bacterium]